ncbi:MFS transporter [Streptomyces sp. AK04-3B]|uniref:MFS transporter n=1 Tax=Streptomyces sp. AK04-3B TaxID=3028650 RepID=UPI0029C000E7|nr:MFS transporter [Streptomyces sp. AK04-3B]
MDAFGWPSVFLVNVPLAAAIALAGLLLFPADGPPARQRHFDLLGALTATSGITLLVLVLVHAPEAGWGSRGVLICAALSVVLLTLFALVEARARDPLTPARMFGHRGLTGAMALTALFSATFSSVPYFLTLYFQTVRGYSALGTGLAFLVPAVVVAAGTQAGERAVAALGVRATMLAGMSTGAVGALLLAVSVTDSGSYARLLPGIVLLSLGQGATWTGMWIAAAAEVAPGDQGIASGMASTTLQVGGAVGLAVLVAVARTAGHAATGAALLDGIRDALYVIAAGICLGAVALLLLRRLAHR